MAKEVQDDQPNRVQDLTAEALADLNCLKGAPVEQLQAVLDRANVVGRRLQEFRRQDADLTWPEVEDIFAEETLNPLKQFGIYLIRTFNLKPAAVRPAYDRFELIFIALGGSDLTIDQVREQIKPRREVKNNLAFKGPAGGGVYNSRPRLGGTYADSDRQ